MQGEYSSQMKVGIYDICYAPGVEIALTEVKGTIQNPFGVMLILLCKKFRE
jgi:hypothetical protein